MIWYALIFSSAVITLLCYRKQRTISRMGIEQTNLMERFFGTDFGVLLWACLTMAAVLLFMVQADPTIPQLTTKQQSEDLGIYKELGKRLGSRAAETELTGTVLVISQRPDEASKKYLDAILEGIKSNLGDKLSFGEVKEVDIDSKAATPQGLSLPFRLSNSELDNFIQLHPNCSVVISLVGVQEAYHQSRLAGSVRAGSRAFILVTDNLYMLGRAIAEKSITHCVAPNPSFNALHQTFTADAGSSSFSDQYIEVNQENLKDVVKRHRRMLFMTQRMD